MSTDLFSFMESATSEDQIADAKDTIRRVLSSLSGTPLIDAINELRKEIHALSPFSTEPVDCVLWFPCDQVKANDYNPNSVAPPEMKLLEVSIMEDGYTQPVVGMRTTEGIETVDGFHRGRIGKESDAVNARVHGYLPVAVINSYREDKADRIAATIRHNRARGKHKVEAMSDIVVELKRRNWSDEKIAKNLGMDQDEILRLCQITGLTDLFSDQEFSKSWDVEGALKEEDFKQLTDDISSYGKEVDDFRTVNTSDEGRVFHTYEKWECYQAGFYNTTKDGMNKEQCEEAYCNFFAAENEFEEALSKVVSEWKNSCEHYLTNSAMNRLAWLGQASVCYALGIPSNFRSGFSLMTDSQQNSANEIALKYLNKWLVENGRSAVTMDEANSGRQADIY